MEVHDICEVKNEDFCQMFLKIERTVILWSMDTEASNFQVRLHFYGSFQKLVPYC